MSIETRPNNKTLTHPKEQTPTQTKPPTNRKLISRRNFLRKHVPRALLVAGALATMRPADLLKSFFRDSEKTSKTPPNLEITTLPKTYDNDLQLPPTEALGATDGFSTIVLPDGRQMILCCDTFKGPLTTDTKGKIGFKNIFYMVNNVAVILEKNSDGTTTQTVISGPKNKDGLDTSWIAPDPNIDPEEKQILWERKTNSFYWLQPGIVQDNKLYIPMTRLLIPTDKSAQNFGWELIGTDIARFDISGPIPTLETITPVIRNKNTQETVAAIVDDNKKEYTYIFRSVVISDPNPTLIRKEMHVARAKYGKIADRFSWEFWNGKQWVGIDQTKTQGSKEAEDKAFNEAKAQSQAVIGKDKGISSGGSVHYINGKYILTNMEERPYFSGKKIQAFVADSPEGPWTEQTLLENIPDFNQEPDKPSSDKSFDYAYLAYLHPEAVSENHPGKSLVTVCRNVIGEDPTDLIAENVKRYRPVSVEVDLNQALSAHDKR